MVGARLSCKQQRAVCKVCGPEASQLMTFQSTLSCLATAATAHACLAASLAYERSTERTSIVSLHHASRAATRTRHVVIAGAAYIAQMAALNVQGLQSQTCPSANHYRTNAPTFANSEVWATTRALEATRHEAAGCLLQEACTGAGYGSRCPVCNDASRSCVCTSTPASFAGATQGQLVIIRRCAALALFRVHPRKGDVDIDVYDTTATAGYKSLCALAWIRCDSVNRSCTSLRASASNTNACVCRRDTRCATRERQVSPNSCQTEHVLT